MENEIDDLREVKKWNIYTGGVPLKYKLNVNLNPTFYSLSKVLERDYADTSDFVDHIEIKDDGTLGAKKILKMNNKVYDIRDWLNLLYKDIPSSI